MKEKNIVMHNFDEIVDDIKKLKEKFSNTLHLKEKKEQIIQQIHSLEDWIIQHE